MLAPGTIVGAWRLVRELGRGTTSVVFAAVPSTAEADPTATEVALKLALPGTLRDEAAVERFLRGARAQQALAERTSGALPVLDLGTDPVAGPYLVMPLIGGPTLGDTLANRTLSAAQALAAIAEVAEVLDAAADAGLVHRDVKPSNVLLGTDRAWLADFGLARDHELDPTTTGAIAGTLAYLAPELVRGATPSPASDRYALACVAFQALTGTPVFPRPTDAAILYAHVDEAPPSASARRPELPPAVDAVLARGLAKAPADRPATAGAFAADLSAAVGEARGLGPAPAAAPTPAGDDTADPLPVTPPVAAGRRPRRGRMLLGGGLLAAVALAAGVLVAAAGDDAPAAPSVPPVGEGLTALGSSLEAPGGLRSRDCNGQSPSGSSPACSLLQTALPNRQLVVPANGLIKAWAVRGASGELTLQVLRRRDGVIYQVSRAETVRVATRGVHRFETELDAEAGDFIALRMAPESTVGLVPTPGARTERWSSPVGAGSPAGQRAGLDQEVLLRAELAEGAVRRPPRQLTGAEAAQAPAGRELAASSAKLPDGREVRVALRQVGDAIVLDLERGGVRRSRLFVPGIDPRGHVVELKAFESPGNASQLNFLWRNPGATKDIERYFGLEPESLDAYT